MRSKIKKSYEVTPSVMSTREEIHVKRMRAVLLECGHVALLWQSLVTKQEHVNCALHEEERPKKARPITGPDFDQMIAEKVEALLNAKLEALTKPAPVSVAPVAPTTITNEED